MTIAQVTLLLEAASRTEARRAKLHALGTAAAWGDKVSQRNLNRLPS